MSDELLEPWATHLSSLQQILGELKSLVARSDSELADCQGELHDLITKMRQELWEFEQVGEEMLGLHPLLSFQLPKESVSLPLPPDGLVDLDDLPF